MLDRVYVLCGVFLLSLLTSCGQGNRSVAEQGVQASMRNIPDLNEFEVIAVKQQTIQDSEYESCYYGVANYAFGTTLSDMDAVETYVHALVSRGWDYYDEADRQPHQQSVVMRDGMGRVMNVSLSSGEAFTGHTEYNQARGTYPTVIFVRLAYYPPCQEAPK